MSVLDASVVLKWFVEEDGSDKAILLRDEYYAGKNKIIVPDLLLYEVANTLRYHPAYGVQEIKSAIQTLFEIDIDIITPTIGLLTKAIDIAKEDDVTCYDAIYLALAEELGDNFVTADEKFTAKLSSKRQKTVLLLKDI